jgi:hypothetical protein
MTAQYLLTIDLGTSAPEAAVVGSTGQVAGTGYSR